MSSTLLTQSTDDIESFSSSQDVAALITTEKISKKRLLDSLDKVADEVTDEVADEVSEDSISDSTTKKVKISTEEKQNEEKAEIEEEGEKVKKEELEVAEAAEEDGDEESSCDLFQDGTCIIDRDLKSGHVESCIRADKCRVIKELENK